ncbi:MAG: RagB/SusD family nutrient uptake outer membrane protein [Prevotella sp.]|nr:RagB/SusD family nutrient uptake outer membrane protein [Prevotella sp.]
MTTRIFKIRKGHTSLLFVLCSFLFSVALTSCSDFLEVKDLNTTLLEDYWTQKSDVDDVVNSCYVVLTENDARERMMIWGEGRSDNVAGGYDIINKADLYNVVRENITARNGYTTWGSFYTVINRCNTVLKYAPMLGNVDPSYTRADLKATIAEMTALRSLCYFYLIRTFRDVPYTTVPYTDDDQKMALPATPFYDVLDSLITSLERVKGDAVTRYPETEPRDQTGRITRDAIYAMLCEMYLWKKDYANCIRYAELVAESKKAAFLDNVNKSTSLITVKEAEQMLQRTNGYPLVCNAASVSNFGEFYRDIFIKGSSYETIFELAYADNPGGSSIANDAISFLYGNNREKKGALIVSETLTSDATKLAGVYSDCKYHDSRLYINFDSNNAYITKYATSRQPVKVDKDNVNENESALSNKRDYYSDKQNGSKWIIYRMSDIMLLEAEALCQQMLDGNDTTATNFNKPLLDQAFTLVNAINKRAICKNTLQDADTLKRSAYTSKSAMTKLVERERRRELMFEGKRYYDLVRYAMRDGNTTQILEAMGSRDDVNGTYVTNFFKRMDAIFWPYNYEEMRVNHSLVPNPAFGSGDSNSYEKTN